MHTNTTTQRTKTGPFRPSDRAYRGVFISGDDALYRFRPALRAFKSGSSETWVRDALTELEQLLSACEQ